ncbi:ADP-ribosylglycohydrolase family protein [Clostridium sp. 'White wine YQ']|uniref:ADP-ribosylglycohydrolase family protein n=1 Tax=Clostridium sp. 'White wine YQ' TaxID=3027474 RepID=UPI0023656C3E|nr:ADP-ribosylglycohydrolase family protein [Clostridium sp. 'White wine YQ']MDD7795434.1 ADP-ribosylglycohydrolase family protein [Clostridium sp. 'White wine YQ']
MSKRKLENFKGCLLGGAIGDALGWPIEFLGIDEIRDKFGESGIEDLVLGAFGKAEITDDTQMTLFTAEGLLRNKVRENLEEDSEADTEFTTIMHNAYLRWLSTQERLPKIKDKILHNSWLVQVWSLSKLRAPGSTCLSALREEEIGTIDNPINSSKGCGGVMRVAPVGLLYGMEEAFDIGCKCAALTHGHPSGYLSAGFFSALISQIISGEDLKKSVLESLDLLKKYSDSQECVDKIQLALELVDSNEIYNEAIRKIGEGWLAEEAISIAVYCALKYQNDYKKAIIAAVNHNGDSDSTGAITGNILGAYLGTYGIPNDYIENIELFEQISEMAEDLYIGYEESDKWRNKYPGK